MRLLLCVLEQNELLDDVLLSLTEHDIQGATVVEGKGMVQLLESHEEGEVPVFGAIRHYLNPGRVKRTVLFIAIEAEKIPVAVEAIENVVGDLSKKDTGVIFSMPIDFVKGLYKDGN